MILGDNTYYVSSSTTSDCSQPCHPLSHYITNTATYFTANATFIFMEGEHLLDSKGLVQVLINNAENLTLRGERGHSNTDIIIRCSSNTRGLLFNNGSIINIYGITVTGCGQQDVPPLLLSNIASLHIHHIILHNNKHYSTNNDGGTLYVHCDIDTHITITESTFTNNTIGGNGGGLYITYSATDIYGNITITDSIFANNTVGTGGGLLIYSTIDIYNDITITNSTFTNNIVGYVGGGLFIHSDTDVYNNINITNSTFNNNIVGINGGGLVIGSYTGIHNNITITNNTFANNIVYGNGGGLFIGSYTGTHNNIHATITGSTFTNNTAGDGSGLYIYYMHNDMTVDIIDSTFTNNIVNSSGGGVRVILIDGTNINITITDSIFINNIAGSNGGGLFIVHTTDKLYNNIIAITGSIIANNTGGNGGGLSIVSGTDSNISITDSIFANNTCSLDGGGLYVASLYGTGIYINTCVTNSTFTNNNRHGLFLRCDIDSKAILSRVIVSNNKNSGIEVDHATVTFTEGHSIVANNSSPTDGGGIYLGKDSYLTTSNGGHVSFINNTALRYGGAIYSPYNDYPMLHYIRHYKYYDVQCTVHNLSATFISNSAGIAGDLLYGGIFMFCNGNFYNSNVRKEIIIQCNNVPNPIKNASSVHPLSPISSDPLAVCPCVNGTVDCNITSLDREVYPGQMLSVSLVTVGLCGGACPGTVVVKHEKEINLISTATTDYTFTFCTTLSYAVKMNNYTSSTTIKLNAASGHFYAISPINVRLSLLPCPLGLMLNSRLGDCVCNSVVTHASEVTCNVSWMPYPIQRSGNNWISRQYGDYNCTIAHIGCPFDYCNTSPVKFALNESDLQCNYNRSGILCGKCIQGLSLMIGSNRCANCTDTKLVSISIAIIAAAAGIVLVILLITLNLTVSVGSINGLLFYVNIVKLNESVFFPRGNIPVISQFISWCNLDLGIEYCFIDGLDGYVKTWLQFVFPLYVWVLVIVIIVGCRYSSRLCRLCGRNAVPVLATLILMSYTKLSRTVTNALMMNTLQCGEHKWNVWNTDGNIGYLTGKHIALFIVSMLFFVTGLVYTGMAFSSQWLQRYSGKFCKSTRDPVVRLKPLIDAYTGPFKDKYRFWIGLCLIVRLILTVVFSFTTTLQSKLNNYIIQLTVGALIIFVGGRVYKNKYLTVVEIISFINLMCLSLMVILFTDESYHDIVSINVIVSVSVSIEILLFVIIITAHCYLAFKKVLPNCYMSHVLSEDELPLITGDVDTEEGSPARVITRREELIFDFYLSQEHP